MPTLKPLDSLAVVALAESVRTLVTAENHVTTGGLATMVAAILQEHSLQRPLHRVGLPDRFIECGTVPALQVKYGLTTDAIAETIARAALGT